MADQPKCALVLDDNTDVPGARPGEVALCPRLAVADVSIVDPDSKLADSTAAMCGHACALHLGIVVRRMAGLVPPSATIVVMPLAPQDGEPTRPNGGIDYGPPNGRAAWPVRKALADA